jgi:DNA-directed RNA polymerase specialized sigma24 family protein
MSATRTFASTSALQVAHRVFHLSATEPTDLYLHGEHLHADLPPGRLLLPPLRDLLLQPGTSLAARDAVWAELIRRARDGSSSWLVAAIGMAMPGLLREARALSLGRPGERDDLESAMAEGFVRELRRVDTTRRALCTRLIRAARRAGLAHLHRDAGTEVTGWASLEAKAPQAPFGHPDFVLVNAVRAGILSTQEAALIAVTRLEQVPIDTLAAELGVRTNTLVVRRHRAEHRLRDAIHAGTVTGQLTAAAASTARRASGPEACAPVSATVRQQHGNRALTQRP